MLALGIRYLNGFVAACEPDARDPGRERPEWPPHPARVFMALAAAHFQSGADSGEREALLWLESLPPPTLRASAAAPRAIVTHYVPVNDRPGDRSRPPTAILQTLPQLARDRQPRTFARAWLEDDTVYLVWPDAVAEPPVARPLNALCGKVTRIGHSMSLVQMWVAGPEEVGDVNWVPDDDRAELYLRVPGPGTLAELERRYNSEAVETYASLVVTVEDGLDKKTQRAAKKRLKEEFGGKPPQRLRPHISFYQGYTRPVILDQWAEVAGTVFSPHLVVFALEARSGPFAALDLLSVPAVVQRWREALVSQYNDLHDRVREVVSGHDRDGAPLAGPHLAFVPLAFVGHPHADGHLLGMAAALPAGLAVDERRHVLRVLGRVDELKLGGLGVLALVRDTSARPPWNLRPDVWTAHPGGATHWSTVIPVAFDRHPKTKDHGAYQREAAEMIAAACTAIGLPRPREVIVTAVSAHLGVPPAHVFPRLQRKDGSDRRHAHAILVFDEPVRGPVLIGAGRYRGYGVCRPLEGGRTL
jgi:CRISPR-associated protein Csb2